MNFKGHLVDFFVRNAYVVWIRLTQSRVFRKHLHSHLRDAVLPVTADGNVYLVKHTDGGIGRSLYVEQASEELPLLRVVFGQLGSLKPSCLIDIGANYGTASISALRSGLVQKSIGFEPDPLLAHLAVCNAILNDLENSFEIRQLALGADCGKIHLELSDLNSGDNRVRITNEPGIFGEEIRKTIQVVQSTLEDEIDEETMQQSIVFCDVQGYEGHVLEGARTLLDMAVPCVLEFWPYGLARVDGYGRLRTALCSSNYRRVKVLEDAGGFEKLSGAFLDDLSQRLGHGSGYVNLLLLRD